MTIKILLVVGIVAAAVVALRGSRSTTVLAVRRLVLVVLTSGGIVSVLFPDRLSWLANQVGVGRGADLVLYLLVVAFAFVTLGLNQRIERLEAQVRALSRKIALRDATEDRD